MKRTTIWIVAAVVVACGAWVSYAAACVPCPTQVMRLVMQVESVRIDGVEQALPEDAPFFGFTAEESGALRVVTLEPEASGAEARDVGLK